MDKAALGEDIFQLISFVIVSARNLLEEPARYGPLRLVDTAARLINIMEEQGLAGEHLIKLSRKIEEGKHTAMGGEDEFEAFLESLVLMMVEEIEKEPA